MQDKILEYLNLEQREAVRHTDGPLFVVAGAGTGKTMTLTSRIAYLVNNGVPAERILTLTFSNKAAREMRDRIYEILNYSPPLPWTSTFHSFGLKFLRRHISILENGMDEAFTVIDEEDAKKIIRDIIKELDIDEKLFPSKNLYNQVSALKVGYHRYYFKSDDLVRVRERYQKYLVENNLADFDDLLLYTLEILVKESTIREHYQEYFEYILVDEFQDTDHIQYEILKLLVNKSQNICVVGDLDQSIYSFRGARYQNNEEFIKDYNAKVITLSKNYRSTNRILDCANRLINENTKRYPDYEGKKLTSDLGTGNIPTFINFRRDIDEAIYVADKINELISFYDYKPNEIAVLYRSNYLSRIFEEVFMRRQIKYVIYGGLSFFQRREIKDILAYIRIAHNHNNDFFLKRIINVPKRKLGDVTVGKLEDYAKYTGQAMLNAISSFDIAPSTKASLMDFHSLIIRISNKINQDIDLAELIDYILKESGYKEMLIAEGEEGIDRIQNVLELKGIMKRGEYLYDGNTKQKLTAILDEISLMTDVDKNVSPEDKVILSTYHQVKGLEFNAVFMVAMEEGVFPNANILDSYDRFDLEEERRIAYVGITRARKHLYLSFAQHRYRFGRPEYNKVSRFYQEAKGYDMQYQNTFERAQVEQPSFLEVGDTVDQTEFGKGKVVAINGDVATIAFQLKFGIKKLVLGHPALKKVNE